MDKYGKQFYSASIAEEFGIFRKNLVDLETVLTRLNFSVHRCFLIVSLCKA